ncbi:MAG: L,D-transpeptidase family protein [Bacteroidetes bacterium]|nr:L,D-transpeptidase family protein [Bacteroidota bacterium]
MQATYSNLRSRLIMGLLLIAITLTGATNSWGNFYSAQLQDSITEASIDSFIAKNQVAEKFSTALKEFYTSNKHQYVWIQSKGIKQTTKEFITHVNKLSPNTIDSSFILQLTKQNFLQSNAATNIELSLSLSFFGYANKWLTPSSIDPSAVNWLIPKQTLSLSNQLKNWLSPATKMGFNTGSQNFKQLLENFVNLSAVATFDTGIHISASNIKITKGEMVPVIRQIKKKLRLLGDFKSTDTTSLYSNTLGIAINKFQERMGLPSTSIIDKALLKAIGTPIQDYVNTIGINVERLRWMPAMLDSNYIVVNIPAYQLLVFDSSKIQFKMPVIVGSESNNTVIFSNRMRYVVFSPYWNVPPSIVKAEILPGIRKNKNYLAEKNMEITTPGDIPTIRQLPGENNSLGLVKFLFPNPYNIYLHDTPGKHLFAKQNRSFSHGCIRLGDARKMAGYLLRNDTSWTAIKIDTAMHQQKEKWVTLKKTIPVFIAYFTSWVDSNGILQFRKDIYDLDEKMVRILFRKEEPQL